MTQISEFEQNIRRHRDGSIDIDYYRTRSLAMRRAAMCDARTLKAFLQFVLVISFAVVGAVVVVLAPPPAIEASCKHCTSPVAPVDVVPAGTHVASSVRTHRAE